MRLPILILGVMIVTASTAQDAELWGRYEVSLMQEGEYDDPFTDVTLTCTFTCGDESVRVDGFCDGETAWTARLMPTVEGEWSYATESNDPGLDAKTGTFTVGPPSAGNHGPVRVHNTHHFAYADGTPYIQIGTTCYAWAHQGDEMEQQTLTTLESAPFNKMRMCVFPKAYVYNENEPVHYPYVGTPPTEWDFTRFNPEFFRHFEQRVDDLMKLGIEADIILLHPYDRWGFQSMPAEADDLYLRYVVARLASYRNVWWSMANEFDFMKAKTMGDWDRFFQIVRDADPYDHMRGNHNGAKWYDHTKPWVTHASIQTSNFANAVELREEYGKPLVYDEVRYEGDVPQGWGNLTGEQLVHHFWLGASSGAYVGHGETYMHEQDILWWSKGGVLHGESPPRIAFLKETLEGLPFAEMQPDRKLSAGNYTVGKPGEVYLVYFLDEAPTTIKLPGDSTYRVDGIDPWEMTTTPLNDAEPGKVTYAPPKANYALLMTAYAEGEERRPQVTMDVEPTEGIAPMRVRFSGPADVKCEWDFGDGNTGGGRRPMHVYEQAGIYAATLTVTTDTGASSTAYARIAVDYPEMTPIVRAGFAEGESHELALNGDPARDEDGGFTFGEGEPWDWVAVGAEPIADLDGLRSLTISGWAHAVSRETGSGGNRILCNLNHNRAGIDMVVLDDGRLRLAVNEWPDGANNDTPADALPLNEWTFFAVTYDSSQTKESVRWYIGNAETPAELVATTDYNKGATDPGSKLLTVGHYNPTLHGAGMDRQFRGSLRAIRIIGSRVGSRGALSVEQIRELQEG